MPGLPRIMSSFVFQHQGGTRSVGEELVAPPPPPLRVLDDVAERHSEGFDPVINGSSVSVPKCNAVVCRRAANDRRAHCSHSPRSEMRLNRFGYFCLVLLTALQSCDLITATRAGGR